MDHFILSAIDPVLGCPILEALIQNPDVDVLRSLAGIEDGDDPDGYVLHPEQATAICAHFGVAFDPITRDILISKVSFDLNKPVEFDSYVTHTGIEVFLTFEGTKPFAIIDTSYPVYTGAGDIEALFRPHVQSGRFIKRVVVHPYEKPVHDCLGRLHDCHRALYYVLPGEEWGIDAYLLIRRQAAIVGWDEGMIRLEGSLLGYTDAQNDEWIAGMRLQGNCRVGRAVHMRLLVRRNWNGFG